jgi:hypothetical protein
MHGTKRVIIGTENHGEGDEYIIALIRPPINGCDQKRNWVAWIRDANNGPQISVKKDRGWILITESISGGRKDYVMFTKDSYGWNYTAGVVIDFADGWLKQGSSYSRGKVVFDSNHILDQALEQIQD